MTFLNTLTTRSSSCGLKTALGLLFLTLSLPAVAQRRISADVEVKQVFQGKVLTTTKSVYCENNGRLVVVVNKPREYVMVTNIKGETGIWLPQSNQAVVDNSGIVTSREELLSLFLSGRIEDLGIGLYGYRLESTERDGNFLVRNYAAGSAADIPHVRIVYDNYLPVYCSYMDSSGKEVSKTYFSNYTGVGKLMFPCRTTRINYTAKGDSTVTRTVYSNLVADSEDDWFGFNVPSDATRLNMQEAAGILGENAR